MNSQYERTRLAWRRTILAVVVIGGLGAVHLASAGYTREASIDLVLTLVAVGAAMHRLRALRREVVVSSWQPGVITTCACLMAMSVFVAA